MASARSHHRCRSRGRSPARSEKVGSKDDPPALGTRPVDARDGAAMVPCRHDGPPRTRPRRTFHHDRDNRSDAGGRGGGGPSLKPRRSLSGFLYVGTKQDNFGLVNKFGRYLHVRIGHGESDKVYNAPRTASLYDSVFMADYHSLRRYPVLGRPWRLRHRDPHPGGRGEGPVGPPTPGSHAALRSDLGGAHRVRGVHLAARGRPGVARRAPPPDRAWDARDRATPWRDGRAPAGAGGPAGPGPA